MSDGLFVRLLCSPELAGAFGMDVARNLMEGIEKIGNPEDQCSFFVNVFRGVVLHLSQLSPIEACCPSSDRATQLRDGLKIDSRNYTRGFCTFLLLK